MTYEQFVEAAYRAWDKVPDRYKQGVDGVIVREEVEAHPDQDDYFTMGLCQTESYPSAYEGPDSTRSILTLYYGSFREVSASDPDFSWEGEIWETITHELRHHLESLVEDEALERVDYAMEQAYRRGRALGFDPWYFRSGLPVGPGAFAVEQDLYLEQLWEPGQFMVEDRLAFEWEGKRWTVPRPSELGDIHFVSVTGLVDCVGTVQLVLIRRIPLWKRLRGAWSRRPLEVLETESEVCAAGESRS